MLRPFGSKQPISSWIVFWIIIFAGLYQTWKQQGACFLGLGPSWCNSVPQVQNYNSPPLNEMINANGYDNNGVYRGPR